MKFKLIREYPGSPKIGTIATYRNNHGDYIPDDPYHQPIPHTKVEFYPEFWEEIIEYPIGTKVFNSQTKTTYTKKEDGWHRPSELTSYTDEQIAQSKHINIMEDVKHAKTPLFATKDGVGIYKGDVYYYVVESDSPYLKGWTALSHQCDWRNPNKPPLGYVQFSTKKAAEKYIEINKPMYSQMQMIDFAIDAKHSFRESYIDMFNNWKLKNNK